MPSSSKKQHNFMAAIAHSPEFAKKAGVPQSVGKDFTAADKGRSFKGGDMATKKLPPFMGKESKAEEAKEKKLSKSVYRRGEKAEVAKYAKGGGIESKGKTQGKKIVMARGGKC